jgi:hypothetical protein
MNQRFVKFPVRDRRLNHVPLCQTVGCQGGADGTNYSRLG